MDKLVCSSFDAQYKSIQSFRNQYLNMIRLILKNKSKLSFEDMLTYNEIENKINNIKSDITQFSQSVLLNSKKKNNVDASNILNESNNHDHKMAETLCAFLPVMILYYNNLEILHNSVKEQKSMTDYLGLD
jgi:hypothetical protein